MHLLQLDEATLTFLTAVTTFGTARDITRADLTLEALYPADAETAQALSSVTKPSS
jgi:hypothetical protein